MEKIISEEELNKLMGINGEFRGISFKGELDFILNDQGKEGLEKIEKLTADLGYPIKYKEIKTMDFYPLGLEGIMFLGARRILGYDDKKFQEMGKFESKMSILIRLFLKYFYSVEKLIEKVSDMWGKSCTVGELKIIEYNQEKRVIILRLEKFELVPAHCQGLIGYFSGVVQMVVGKAVVCEETKCTFRGDEYHEFLLKW